MKAAVVIDMPSKCVVCRLLKPGLNNYCPIGELTPADIWHKRDDNCPLKPLPEELHVEVNQIEDVMSSEFDINKLTLKIQLDADKLFALGWNAYRDKIKGENND